MKVFSAKSTPARKFIAEFLSSSKSPVDIESIISFLRSKNLKTNKVTVYRTIEFLRSKGMATRVEFGEGKYRYEAKKEDHHHLICSNCGKVGDIPDKFMHIFEKEIREKKRFLVKNHALEFFGICFNCQS